MGLIDNNLTVDIDGFWIDEILFWKLAKDKPVLFNQLKVLKHQEADKITYVKVEWRAKQGSLAYRQLQQSLNWWLVHIGHTKAE